MLLALSISRKGEPRRGPFQISMTIGHIAEMHWKAVKDARSATRFLLQRDRETQLPQAMRVESTCRVRGIVFAAWRGLGSRPIGPAHGGVAE